MRKPSAHKCIFFYNTNEKEITIIVIDLFLFSKMTHVHYTFKQTIINNIQSSKFA